jgi:hypothetical protein
MGDPLPRVVYGPSYTAKITATIATCSAAIARLDTRFSVSSVSSAWLTRAAWSGYARALQLQSVEIDEIDVFSWGCGLQIPGRPHRATTIDPFDHFDEWRECLRARSHFVWRDRMPTAVGEPSSAADHPPLIRALDRVRQHARIEGTMKPWLGLPFALRDLQVSQNALACLAGGAKAFRLKQRPSDEDWLATIRALETSARHGLERLDKLERLHRHAQRAIAGQYRSGALPALAALTCHRPLLSPQSVANLLGMSVAGASKLLSRAASAGLVVEITQRRTWRLFLASDLAAEFGYARPTRGRPKLEPPPLPASRDLSSLFDAFDAEMAAIDAMLSR